MKIGFEQRRQRKENQVETCLRNRGKTKMIVVDLYLEKAMSYEAIRDHLNKKGIPCPSGKGPWSTGTIAEMLRDNRLDNTRALPSGTRRTTRRRESGSTLARNGPRLRTPTPP
jgi:hypothetical protein